MTTDAIGAEQATSDQKLPPAELEVSVTVVAAPSLDGFEKASWVWSVATAEQVPATVFWAAVVNTSFDGAAGFTVWPCEAGVRTPAAVVKVGVRALVSFQ